MQSAKCRRFLSPQGSKNTIKLYILVCKRLQLSATIYMVIRMKIFDLKRKSTITLHFALCILHYEKHFGS